MWNPDVYLTFADQRARPFFDLISRVGAEKPRRVVDLGCGPGNLTVSLGQRWPGAVIEALDSSPEMVQSARDRGIEASVGDVRAWAPKPDTDVVLSNATLQWVPEHAELLVRWAGQLSAGSWIAMQMPGNFDDEHVRRSGERRGPARPRRLCEIVGRPLLRQGAEREASTGECVGCCGETRVTAHTSRKVSRPVSHQA